MTPCHFPEINLPSITAWLAGIKQGAAGPLVFALLPEGEKTQVAALQALFNDSEVTLLGAIFPALVTEDGFATSGITFLCFQQAPEHFLTEGLTTNSFDAAQKIAESLKPGPANSPSATKQLFLVFDSMLSNTGSILANLFDRLDQRLNFAGVNAGSETFQPMPCLFDNHRLLSNGVIGIFIDRETQIAVQHGYPVSKQLMRASSTQGNRIDKIDGQPAMSVYQRVIAAEYGITLTPENFYDYAVHYPFGLISSLEILVRIPVAFNDDGSIICVGEVPPSSMLRLLKAPALADSNCVRSLVGLLGKHPENPLIAFYCAGRRMHFGSEATTEIRDLLEKSGSTAIFGALSLGEISTDSELGIPEFHNAALVCVR